MPAPLLGPSNRNVSFNHPVPADTCSAPIQGSTNETSTNVSARFGAHYYTIPAVTSSASLEAEIIQLQLVATLFICLTGSQFMEILMLEPLKESIRPLQP